MLGLLSRLIALIAVVTGFFSPKWAWLPLLLLNCWILVTLRSLRRRMRFAPVPELSSAANRLLRRFGHFYAMPWAGADFSSASSTMVLAGVLLGIIGAAKGFWLGLAFAAVNYLVMGYVGWQFNPTRVLIGNEEHLAHDELLAYFAKQRSTPSHLMPR
jgi:hypothetical protein